MYVSAINYPKHKAYEYMMRTKRRYHESGKIVGYHGYQSFAAGEVAPEKIYSLEHQHLLSGLVCCPECGRPMYGSVNRKRKKDGSFYRDYWYYACKHRLGF